MVQFISAPQPKPKSVASQLLEGAAEGALGGYQTYLMQKERNRLLAKEQKETEQAIAKEAKKREAYEKLGIPADVDPQVAKEILKQRETTQRQKNLYNMLGLSGGDAQQVLGTAPQAQGMPQQIGQPMTQPGVGEPDTAWMDAVGLPEQDRAQAPQAMSAWENMSDAQRAAIAIQEPQLARILEQGREFNQRQQLQEREFGFRKKLNEEEKQEKLKKEERRQFEVDRDYHSKISRPIIEEAAKRIQDSSFAKGIREQLRRDISSGETSGFWPFLVDKMGLESFRNPESARFSNEVKNLFVGSLNEIPGARPNQFIERFLSTAQPLIGRTPEANLTVMDVSDFVEDMRDELAKKELQIAKEDNEKFGYVKDDVKQRALERMGDYANRRQEQMAIQIRERHEKDKTTSDLLWEVLNGSVPDQTPLTPKMMRIFYIKNGKDLNKAVEEAKKSGFVIPQYLD